MKSPFSGLSLVIHLVIIATATLVALLIGQRRVEVFKRSVWTAGAVARYPILMRTMSIMIIVALGLVMFIATTVAVQTGYREGSREPHMIFIKKEFAALEVASGVALTRLSAIDSNSFPDFATRSFTYVRADNY